MARIRSASMFFGETATSTSAPHGPLSTRNFGAEPGPTRRPRLPATTQPNGGPSSLSCGLSNYSAQKHLPPHEPSASIAGAWRGLCLWLSIRQVKRGHCPDYGEPPLLACYFHSR